MSDRDIEHASDDALKSPIDSAVGVMESRHPPTIIDFAPNDPEDPLNWSKWYKWTIITLVSLLSALVQLGIVIAAPVAPQIQRDLHAPSSTYTTLLVTIWELGEVVGPLLYGPLSERFGRLPVVHATSALLVLFCVGCALSPNISTLIAMRFLAGASVAVTSIAGGIVRDLFVVEERGPALSLMMIGSQVGPALGPIVGSFLGEAAGWRWAFWLCAILAGAVGGLFALFYRETYRVRILARRVAALRRSTGDATLKSRYEEAQEKVRGWRGVAQGVFRPVYLLTRSWALAGVTAFISVFLGLQYLALTTVAPAFQGIYHFSEGQSGLAYLGLYAGMMVGCAYFNIAQHVAKRRAKKHNGKHDEHTPDPASQLTPEQRLMPATAAAASLTAGFLIFGWTLAHRTHWIAPILGTSLIGGGYFVATTSVRAYIVDAFGVWAVSASAAMFAVRNAAAAGLPLVGPPLFARLGAGWGGSVLALVALCIAPVPLLFVRFGARLRARSRLRILE